MAEIGATARPAAPPVGPASARTFGGRRRHRRDRGQGAARPHARTPRVRHPDHLPAAPGRLRADGRAAHGDAASTTDFGGTSRQRRPVDRPGHLRGPADADDPAGRLPRPVLDGRRDQPRAREADPRTARHDADQLARDRHRQAAVGARLRLPADRRLDPADGGRVRVRRRRPRGRHARLHRADRHRHRPRIVRAAVLEPRQAHDGRHGDHDLRRSGDHDRDGVRAGLLAGDELVRCERQPARLDRSASATPTPLAWVNPFIAQADVLCGTESAFGGGWCGVGQRPGAGAPRA